MGKITAAKQKKMTATKPIHLAYSATDLLQTETMMRTRVVVTLMHPRMTETRLRSQTQGRLGG